MSHTAGRDPPGASLSVSRSSSHLPGVVHGLLGVLLLAAAGLKLFGRDVSPYTQYGWFSTPAVQTAAVVWELALGAWLLSGVHRSGAWAAAAGTFLAFAGVSGYLGLIGQASCGCFGAVKASPWHAFAVDITALGLLAATWPRRAVDRSRATPPFGLGLIRLAAGPAIIVAGLATYGVLTFGSLQGALARLRGERASGPRYVDFGTVRPGQLAERTAEVTNYTDEPIRLIGGTSDCSCVTTSDLPVTIQAGETVAVRIILKPPETSGGVFTRLADLWTDDAHQPRVRLRLGGRVE